MPKSLDLFSTLKGSLLDGFYPRGWDLRRMDACCDLGLKKLTTPAGFWHGDFKPVVVKDVVEMDRRMGDAIADEIERSARRNRELALILPVGPMGMYKTVVSRIKRARLSCDHVTTFNMDEWSDRAGHTMRGDQPGGFEHAMNEALFAPLGRLTVPRPQRNFATRANLPTYAEKMAALRARGARLVTVYGVGRVCHIAFWEPQLAGEYSFARWKRQTHRLGVALHPLTIEQNAITSFASRFTLVPCFANTIGPSLSYEATGASAGATAPTRTAARCGKG